MSVNDIISDGLSSVKILRKSVIVFGYYTIEAQKVGQDIHIVTEHQMVNSVNFPLNYLRTGNL